MFNAIDIICVLRTIYFILSSGELYSFGRYIALFGADI